MKKDYPKAQIILDYSLVYGIKPPDNRLSLLKGISKIYILYELTALNYRLKPKTLLRTDTSLESQVRELRYFAPTENHYKFYLDIVSKHTVNKDDFPIIFNRPACLLAIEELISSKEINNIEKFSMNIDSWDRIIKYLLAVNFAITQIKEEKDNDAISFEKINSKLIALNELMIETDPVFTPYRGLQLIKYFKNSPLLKDELKKYFEQTYGIQPEEFVFNLIKIYLANNSANPDHDFIYLIKEEDQTIFDNLSIRHSNNEAYKLISIRKSPLIKVGKLRYLIADNSFLLEKIYYQFINDFWFDWIKGLEPYKITIESYRSEFGYFFEHYTDNLLTKCFINYKYAQLLKFKQLKLTTKKGDIEIADVYLRYSKKILLAQVKSSSIYDKEKYGGDLESLYKNDRNEFFKNFGVNQLIDSIKRLEINILKVDPKFPTGKAYHIFPCIIYNEKALQTLLMADTFNNRFQELLSNLNINKVVVRPLCLIHISDLERIEETLVTKPNKIWELLKLNHNGRKFIHPLFDTINRNWKEKMYPPRIMQLYKELISRFEEKAIGNNS